MYVGGEFGGEVCGEWQNVCRRQILVEWKNVCRRRSLRRVGIFLRQYSVIRFAAKFVANFAAKLDACG